MFESYLTLTCLSLKVNQDKLWITSGLQESISIKKHQTLLD